MQAAEDLAARDGSETKPSKLAKTDGNASFLRAARAGNLEKVFEYLKGSTDINTSNANGLNALHLASKEGHVNVVTELLKRGANVDAATKKGNTALHIASLAGQEEIVKILAQTGAKVNVQSQNGFTPLYMAAQENHANVVKFLLSNGASQSLATEDGFTPLAVALQQGHNKVVAVLLENDSRGRVRLPALHIAAKKDDIKAATLLLQNEHNVDSTSKSGDLVNDTTKSGFTPLHISAHYGNTNVGGLLLEKGADPNFKARNAIMPMHVASKWGRTTMVVLLLDNGADLEGKTRDGLTPLHCAARSGHVQVVDILLERGAPVSDKTKNGLTPIHMASQGDHVDCARLLLYHKAQIDDVTVDYLTPLHVSAHCGNVKTAKLLLDRKCEVNARALNGFTPLHIACKKNRIKVVELLLKYGASIEATTESGLSPLHVASFMGHMNIVIFLIQHGASPDVTTVRGETALHLAARANQTDIIRILLRNGAFVDAKAREQQTPLHIASRLGNVDNVLLLLQHGASPEATTKDLYTPLHIAAKEGHEEVASVLLEHGAPLNNTTKKGFSPLHIASKYGNIRVARLLLQREADPNVQGKNGLTPLHVATHYNHVNVALLLLENGASPHCTAKNGYTPLHIAAKKNQMDIATTLLEYGAKPDAESRNGFTPLHLASQEGHTDMVSLLLERGGDVNCKAKNGLTPMHLAAQEDKVPVAEILVKYNSETDQQTKAGYTSLHTACHFGQINMIRFLLEQGASVNATTKVGYTPLHQAAQQGHVLVINLLLKYKGSPNAVTNAGQTPLSIAERLGYISVVEILKNITEVTVASPGGEKYKVVSPETMVEAMMTDSENEDELGDTMLGDRSYQYLTTDDMKMLADDSISPMKDDRDLRFFERFSTTSNMGPEESRFMSAINDSTDYPSVFNQSDSVQEEMVQAQLAPNIYAPKALGEESRTTVYDSYSGVSFGSGFDPDNVAVDRQPVYSGFLVSFMVDARGGAMRGCRHSGVRIIVPPGKACMPTRVTCKLVKKEKLTYPPPLMENEALASRILEMGPVAAKFLGPVIIEVPHFASLRGKEREIVILRSDNGETWYEHSVEATEEAIHQALNGSFEGEDLETAEELYQRRITRIITTDFPQYFAVVSRIREESSYVGREGGMLSSTVVPQVQAQFPEGALTKQIKVGLQAQPVPADLVAKMLGNRVAVSPIVTVEPRRRKFHKPITLTVPVPKASQKGMLNQYGGDAPTLRLLCSITGGSTPAQWEDITGTTPLTFVNDCVSFTSTVSARYWLMDCQNVNEAAKMATDLYREVIAVPFMSKFVVFAKRRDPQEAKLRMFCMTDDRMDKTLEMQEHFKEVARSRDVEVLEGKPQYVEMGGNLVPITKSGEQLYINFHAFRENRLPLTVRLRDSNQEPIGRVAFMREPKISRGEAPQTPICTLNIVLPEQIQGDSMLGLDGDEMETKELLQGYPGVGRGGGQISKAELRLTDIADTLQGDWVILAHVLNITEEEITKIQMDYTYVSEQALVMLELWASKSGGMSLGNELERGLKKIGRDDVIDTCIYNVEEVTDEVEQAVANFELEQTGFDDLKEELGDSRGSSMQRGESLDVSYDEEDLIKESESAAEETDSGAGSIVERDLSTPTPVAETPEEDQIVPSRVGNVTERVEDEAAEGQRKQEAYLALAEELDTHMDVVLESGQPGDTEVVEDTLFKDTVLREPVVPMDDLIKKVSVSEVEGMDDRVSLSSDDSMIIHDEKPKKDGTHVAVKTKTPPPSPAEGEVPRSPGQEVCEQELASRVAQVEQVEVTQTAPALRSEASSLSDIRDGSPSDAGSPVESDDEGKSAGGMRVFMDTKEGEPVTETDVQEFEETLPDGTIVKRKVVKTTQKQTVVKRVIMDSPEGEMPAMTDDQGQWVAMAEPEMVQYGDKLFGEPETTSDVQEYDETLPDGTVVKRRVVTKRTQQMVTERTIVEGAGDMLESMNGMAIPAPVDETSPQAEDERVVRSEAAVDSEMLYDDRVATEDTPDQVVPAVLADFEDEATGGEVAHTRVVMKKQIHKKTVIRNGKEETIVVEDTQIEQDDDSPEELHESVQQIVDQFMEGSGKLGEDAPQ